MKSLKINTKLASLVPCEKIEDSVKKGKLECSQISENIFISGYNVSLDLDYLLKENFTHILNCAYGSKNFKSQIYDNFEYLLLDLKDEPEFDIIYAIYLSIDFLEKCQKKNGKVLIHCVEVKNNLLIIRVFQEVLRYSPASTCGSITTIKILLLILLKKNEVALTSTLALWFN
jgi:hypothetical protein